MTVDEIIESCVDIIQDGAYTSTEVAAILDELILSIGALVRIPSSKKIGSVTISAGDTSTNVKDSLSDFDPMYCSKVWNSTTEKFVNVYDSLELLFAEYPAFDEDGDIEAVAFEDFMLWTQKVAEEDQALSIIYYATPVVPSISDKIDHIPAGLHYNLVVCGVVAQCYGELEDGFEGIISNTDGKPNTGFYASRFMKGINDYRKYVGRYSKHRMSSFWSE